MCLYKKFVQANLPDLKAHIEMGDTHIISHVAELIESFEDGAYCNSCLASFINTEEYNDSEFCEECYKNDEEGI